jgi:hypothetical protein
MTWGGLLHVILNLAKSMLLNKLAPRIRDRAGQCKATRGSSLRFFWGFSCFYVSSVVSSII